MNVNSLTEYLVSNPDAVLLVLESLGVERLARRDRQIRFAHRPGGNPSAVVFNLDSLSFKCFSTNERGSLYSLIMMKRGISFPASLDYVAQTLGLERAQFQRSVSLPFGGFYRGLIHDNAEPELTMKTYDESLLTPYAGKLNTLFVRDGISLLTQEKFQIGYDHESDRITIPIYTFDDKLCGILGRLNDSHCRKEERYLPILPCSRSLTLYGYSANYAAIQQKGLCVIVEAEKGVMQMDSFGSFIGLSTSGSSISATQARYIKSLMLPRLIVAYDEGLPEEKIREEAAKLKSDNPIVQNRVGYVYDRDHDILVPNSKQSPSDVGRKKFSFLIKNRVIWL